MKKGCTTTIEHTENCECENVCPSCLTIKNIGSVVLDTSSWVEQPISKELREFLDTEKPWPFSVSDVTNGSKLLAYIDFDGDYHCEDSDRKRVVELLKEYADSLHTFKKQQDKLTTELEKING